MKTRDEMENKVQEELMYIPYIKNNLPQNLLRKTYYDTRLSKFQDPDTKEHALKSCLESLKQQHPDWEPVYDKDFFKI